MQVLIADDDPTYRSLLEGLLREWHFEAIVVEDGQQAWEILQRKDAPKLVLLDWMMPEMDGFEVCKNVRDMDDGDNTYILIITGSRSKKDMMRVVVAGADDYLMKPFEPIDLKIHLRNATRFLRVREELDELRQAGASQPADRAWTR